jgi:hypothetical protein
LEDQTVALGAEKPVAQRAERTGGTSRGGIATSGGTATLSASLETLARDEIRRTRRFCYGSVTMSLVTVLALPWLGGDPAATTLLRAALVLMMLAATFLLYRTRDPVQFRRPSTSLVWLVLAVASTTAIPYFGAFSAAPIIIAMAYRALVGHSSVTRRSSPEMSPTRCTGSSTRRRAARATSRPTCRTRSISSSRSASPSGRRTGSPRRVSSPWRSRPRWPAGWRCRFAGAGSPWAAPVRGPRRG